MFRQPFMQLHYTADMWGALWWWQWGVAAVCGKVIQNWSKYT